jgi:hypothetical protein
MITSRMLAIYLFLIEIGTCDQAEQVFWPDISIDRSDLRRVLYLAELQDISEILDTAWKWVDFSCWRQASEELLIEVAYLYGRKPGVDSTFRRRFLELLHGTKTTYLWPER